MGFLKRFGRSSEIIDLTDEKEKAALWAEKNRPKMKFQGDFADLTPDSSSSFSSDSQNNFQSSSSEFSESSSSSDSAFSFLDSFSSPSSSSSSFSPSSSIDSDDVTKKMQVMSRRIEDQSNEIYHLMQKIELLERKINRMEGKDTDL